MVENEKKNAIFITYVCTVHVHNPCSEMKNGLFYKQQAPHMCTDSLAAPADQFSVQYFTFGQLLLFHGSTTSKFKYMYVQSNQKKASKPIHKIWNLNLIGVKNFHPVTGM